MKGENMKFHIESTRWGTKEKDLIDHYPMLKEFGYKDEHVTIDSLEAFMDLVNNPSISNNGIIVFLNTRYMTQKQRIGSEQAYPASKSMTGTESKGEKHDQFDSSWLFAK
jgi:hypothetical protein